MSGERRRVLVLWGDGINCEQAVARAFAQAGAPVETRPANNPDQQPAFAGQTRAPGVTTEQALTHAVVATGLENPWGLAWLPDGGWLVTEKAGRLRVIGVDGAYDPGFYPDNSGFMFQGTPRGTGTCAQSVLTTGMPTRIRFSEVGCSSSDVGLYQHLGASLDGGDYWVVNSVWSGDPGDELSDPQVFADPSSRTTLLRFTNTGSGASFVPAGEVSAATAWEGNAVISPTMRMLVTQLARASGEPLGYVLRGIELTRDASGAVTSVELPELARYCLPGGKAAISLDDRWIVTHHRATNADATDLGFSGPSDPGFAAYRGVSNVYLIDVLTGREIRVTNMQPGQRALFPHFRSDGWLYFLVRDRTLPERIVASDAGIVLR